MEKSKYIDHTNLKPNATKEDIKKLCLEAIKYDFKSVCINPSFIEYAASYLKDSNVLICTVIGFPLGGNTTVVKEFETINAISEGADEIDMVINISKALDKDYDYIYNEIKTIIEASKGKVVKVILETSYFNSEEIKKLCEIAVLAKATFVKTSTGFSSEGATILNVKTMFETVKGKALVKASGGVRNLDDFNKMIEAGASRIGASSGVAIMEGLNDENSTY